MRIWEAFHRWINGQPNVILTIGLLILSLFGILVALIGDAALKALVIAYWLFP